MGIVYKLFHSCCFLLLFLNYFLVVGFPETKNKFILYSIQSSGILLCKPLIRHFISYSGMVVFSAALGATVKVRVRPGFFIDRASSCECSQFKDSRTSNRTVRGKVAHGRGNAGTTVGWPPPPSYRGTFTLFSSQGQRETHK